MNTTNNFSVCFRLLCKKVRNTERINSFTLSHLSIFSVFFMLLILPSKLFANTDFNVWDRNHLNISLSATNNGFNTIDFRVLSYDYDGIDDVMSDVKIYITDPDTGVKTLIINHGGKHESPNNVWKPANSVNNGYFSGLNLSSTGDLRFHNYSWQYAQRFSGKQLKFIVEYKWDRDHNGMGKTGDKDGTFSEFIINVPAYLPTFTAASFVPQAGGNVKFTYSRAAGSSPVNKVYVYSDATKTKLLNTFTVDANSTTGTSTFLWNNSFASTTNLYVEFAFVINDAIGAGTAPKEYKKEFTFTDNGYIKPQNLDKSVDKCSHSVTLSWNINSTGNVSNSGQWIVERKLTSQPSNQYTEVANSIAATQKIYTDNSIQFDRKYNYRVRFIPTGMDKSRLIKEFSDSTIVDTKRTVLNTMTFETFTKTSAENPKIVVKWVPNWCFTPQIILQRKNTVTNVITDITITSKDNNNANTYSNENLTENLLYQYRFKINTEDSLMMTPWQDALIKDEVKYVSVTSSKGTLADRIQLKWNIERNDLSNSFFIKRQVFEEGKENPKVDVTNISTNGKYYSFDDREISPGVLYKYTLASLFTLQSGKIDTVYYKKDIIGYAQANGTISGRVTFGSGTSVDSVSVFASNANESESLYRAIKFSGSGKGEVALSTSKHGCVKDGFTWQAWIQPHDASSDMAVYECLKEYSIWYENSTLKVYLDQIDAFDPMISYNMSNITANDYFHASVTFDGDATLKLFIDGKLVATRTLFGDEKTKVDVCENLKQSADTTIAYLGDGFYSKGAFRGNVDDLRLYDHPLTDKEIASDYNRYINGNETGLIGYWQFDEGLNRYAFDKSNYKKNYNEHHIVFTTAESSKSVPTLEQLSIKGITDKNGNYLISGIPFTGDGSTYAFTPSKQSHEFEPSQLNRYLTYQTSVHNAVDFKDVSSFKVRVKAVYDNTDFPVDSVDIKVDGTYIFKDQKTLATNADGECIVDVPIGIHTLSVSRRGHTFVDGSKVASSITMNFKEPILGNPIVFYDQTKVVVAGRLVGGVIQAEKPLGFGLSKANIGEAEITLEAQGGDFQLNLTNNQIDVAGANDTISSTATVQQGSKKIKITTDANTGEFRVLLPPLKYKVTDVTTRGGLNKTNFTLSEFQPDPNKELNDTARINNTLRKFNYHQRLDFTYRAENITIKVFDPLMPEKVFGDSVFMYTNLTNNTTVKIPLYNTLNNNYKTPVYLPNTQPDYKYGYPVFQTTNIYKMRILAYEQYTHPDNLPEMADFCKVPASNAKISIQNELGRYELPLGSDGDPSKGDEMIAKNREYEFNEEGVFDYAFKAGFPNLEYPYTLGMKITVDYKDKKSNWDQNSTFKAIVLGDILTGTDFVTSGPDLITFVLRDPPGSNSYSYMEKGTTVSNSYSFNRSYVGSENFLGIINYGQSVRVAVGLGVAKLEEFEIDNKTGAGFEISQKAGHGSEINFSTTTTERLETSSSPDYVGRRGDIFVGTSTNLFFGSSRRLAPTLVAGKYELSVKEEKVGDLTAKTNFKYTYAHIVETLIPNIITLRNNLIEYVPNTATALPNATTVRYVSSLNKEDENFGKEGTYRFITPATRTQKHYENEVMNFNTSLANWVKQLAKEEDAKLFAMQSKEGEVYNKSNESMDAGVTSEKSVTICGSSNTSEASTFTRQGVVKTENGLAYNDLGYHLEFQTKHGTESETVEGEGKEYCTTYGYVISDENAGDYLSVDVYTPVSKPYEYENKFKSTTGIKNKFDTYSGAPLFITRGGRTSCPYEAQEVAQFSTVNKGKSLGVATLQVEKPQLRVTNPTATEIPSGKEATYKITLSNLSESKTAGWYMLTVDEKTNTKGAIITIDGQTLGNGKLYYVIPDEPMEKVLKLKQSSLDELNFDKIKLLLSSTCQSDINSSIEISAQFVPSCSDVTLEIANKIVNATTSDILPIKITNYNRDYKNFGGIVLKYKTINQDETEWTTIRKFVNNPTILAPDQTSENIAGASISFDFSMKNNTDQTYQFKAFTVCQFGTGTVQNESEVITVIKDMVTPTSLGTPSPSNGILTPESEVSITFNEDIQNSLINSSSLKVEGVLNGYTLKHNVGLEFTGANEAYTEQQFNLQSVPVSVEGWIKTNQVNTNATLFAIGEGTNQLKLQLNGNVLKAIAGTEEYTGNIVADENWQYVSLGYNPTSKKLTVNVTGQMNNNVKVINQTLTGAVEPSGRLSVGKGYKGELAQLSLWINSRELADMAVDRNTSKSGREAGLIGYWPLNEGSGTLAADKVNSRSLTLKTGWYIDPKGKAIQLNGTNQNVLISTATIPVTKNQDYSVEFWFKAGQQTNTTLFSCGKGVNDLDSINNLSVGFDAAGKLTVYAKGVAHLITNDNLQDNQWHHFAISVLRRGNTNVLIDGVSKYQIISSKFGGLTANKMSLGARYYKTDNVTYNYTTDQYLNGTLDELRIWKGALTAENIRLDMNNKLKGSETGLIAYYPFEEYTVNGANQTVITGSLKDAVVPSEGALSGGVATGTVAYTDLTPAIKEARVKENVYFNWTSTNNKIVFNILEPLKRIENCVLEFTVDRALDLNGNRMAEPVKWTVFVDNNRLKWESDKQSHKKEVLAPLTFKTNIVNNSGKYENYVIDGLPTWLSVNKSSGTLNPLEKAELTFTVNNSVNVGSYETRISLTGNNGIQELLPVALKVTGARPDWTVNPYDYESSMNVTGQVKIEGVYQEDTEDILAAFNGTKCVGMAQPQFNKLLNSYFVYLDIYGNSDDTGKELTFSLWDAGTGRIYPGVDVVGGAIQFVSGAITGNVASPKIFNTTDKVEQQLSGKQGWTWLSTNVVSTTPSLLEQVKTGLGTDGLLIKSKANGYVEYATGAWSGTLSALNQNTMYLLKSTQAKTVKVIGATAKSVSYPITINPSWNWIGYIPQFVAPVKEALSGLTANEGDQIKGQIGYATYTDGTWNGSLDYLVPGLGYMYYSTATAAKSFVYPSQYISKSNVKQSARSAENMYWSFDGGNYQSSMTVTSVARINDLEVASTNVQVGVFIDDVCRGNVEFIYNSNKNRYIAYISIWGNTSDLNKKVTFKSFDVANNKVFSASDNTLDFVPDNIVGNAASPYVINFNTVDSNPSDLFMGKKAIYPNPVVNTLNFNYDPQDIEAFEIVDNMGRKQLYSTVVNKNSVNVGDLIPGVYTVRITCKGTSYAHRFIKK